MALSVFTLQIADHYGKCILWYANAVAVRIERLIGVEETIICNMCACKIATVPHIMSVSCPQCDTCIKQSARLWRDDNRIRSEIPWKRQTLRFCAAQFVQFVLFAPFVFELLYIN